MRKWDRPGFIAEWQEICKAVHELSKSQGFWEGDRHIAIPIALCHSELSEALEASRFGREPDKNISYMTGLEVQLSDALGILADMEMGYGLQIGKALLAKMEFNESRGWMHGGKYF